MAVATAAIPASHSPSSPTPSTTLHLLSRATATTSSHCVCPLLITCYALLMAVAGCGVVAGRQAGMCNVSTWWWLVQWAGSCTLAAVIVAAGLGRHGGGWQVQCSGWGCSGSGRLRRSGWHACAHTWHVHGGGIQLQWAGGCMVAAGWQSGPPNSLEDSELATC